MKPALQKTVNAITFEYHLITEPDATGINPEIVIAAFQAAGDKVAYALNPRKRAMAMFSDADDLLFLGEARYFPDIIQELDAQKFIYFHVGLLYKKDPIPYTEV